MKKSRSALFIVLALVLAVSTVLSACASQPAAPAAPAAPAKTETKAEPAAPAAQPKAETKAEPAAQPKAEAKADAKAGPAKQINVGVWAGLTGPASEAYLPLAHGMQLGADWVNGKGGVTVNGEKYTINLLMEDSQVTPDGSVAAANKLIFSQKVKILIGGSPIPPLLSAVTAIAEPNKVLQMNVGSLGGPDELGKNMPYTFTTMPAAPAWAPGIDALREFYPNVKNVGLWAPEDPGVVYAHGQMKKMLDARGMKVVTEESHPFGANDFYPMLNKMLAAKPDALMATATFHVWAGAIMKQARELGFKGPVLVNNATSDPYVIRDLAGDYATDYVGTQYALKNADAQTPPMIAEIEKMEKAKYKEDFLLDHVFGFETVWYLAQAIEKAQSAEPDAIKAALEKLDSLDGPLGKAKLGGLQTYGANHMILRPAQVIRIQNKEVKFVKWFMPEMP